MSAVATSAAPALLNEVIWGRFVRLLDIKRRLYVMRAFVDELDRVSRGKPFTIRNDIVWNAMLDVRDKLVIDFYSLTVEMRHGMKPLDPRVAARTFRGGLKKKRGLFIEIRDHYLASLTRTYVRHPNDDDDEFNLYTQTRAAQFTRLFPDCTTDSPNVADIEALCERFRIKMVPLGNDRNKNRAHALEGEAGTATMMSVPQLEALFDYAEQVLEDLSLVSALSALCRTNLNHANCVETAADMVDLILLGNFSDVRRLTVQRTRDELYARVHKLQDEDAGGVRQLHFNDRQFAAPFTTERSP